VEGSVTHPFNDWDELCHVRQHLTVCHAYQTSAWSLHRGVKNPKFYCIFKFDILWWRYLGGAETTRLHNYKPSTIQ